MATFVLKDPTSAPFVSECIQKAKIKKPTADKAPEKLFSGKELAETTKQFVLDIDLMTSVDVEAVANGLKDSKEMNKPLYKEFQKSMSSIYGGKDV